MVAAPASSAASCGYKIGDEEQIIAGPARGKIVVDIEECKGCRLCVESCPSKCLEFSPELSHYGVHAARYSGHACTGCGIGFLSLSGAGRD